MKLLRDPVSLYRRSFRPVQAENTVFHGSFSSGTECARRAHLRTLPALGRRRAPGHRDDKCPEFSGRKGLPRLPELVARRRDDGWRPSDPGQNIHRPERRICTMDPGLSVVHVLVVLGGLWGAKADVIISSSPHLFVAYAGCAHAFMRRVPHVIEVRDLCPSLLENAGLRRGLVYRFLEGTELMLYRRSARSSRCRRGSRMISSPGASLDKRLT